MSKLSEMPAKVQVALIVGVAIAVTAVAYLGFYKSMDDSNRANRLTLEQKQRDNDMLRPYERNMNQLLADIESLKQQLERQKLIVPDEKEADQFMRLMQTTAAASGIEIRKYKSRPTVQREFYVEVPFDIELDGPYFGMLTFFERVGKLERIINVSNLEMGALRNETGFRKGYQYGPHESVGAKVVATTFFSRDASADQKAQAPKKQ